MDFSKFDKEVNLDQLKKDAEEIIKNGGSGDYPEIEAGTYKGKFEKLEIAETKDGRPMLKAMFRITEGPKKKCCLFLNRVLYGTKNDANMIASAVGWLESLDPSEEVGEICFESFSQFNELVMDILEDISELVYDVDYDPNGFNTISVKEIYD